jgi:phosphocarrier protein FPr
MKQLDIIIENPTGLHARPAKVFVTLAKQYKCDIRVQHGEKKANAKSLISMLTLGAEKGARVSIIVEGEDEEIALDDLAAAIATGLGEGEQIEAKPGGPAPKPAAATAPAMPTAPAAAPAPRAPALSTTPGNMLRGMPAAPGIAIGPLFQLQRAELVIAEEPAGSPVEEENRLRTAIEKARFQIGQLHKQLLEKKAGSEADIFEVHMELLEDAELLDGVLAKIRERSSAARAWQATIEARARLIATLKDPLLAARSADLHDVGYRVLRILMGVDEQGYALPEYPVIVVARDLSPSDTASLPREKVLGFCTAAGGPTSHTAIIARALSLPAVVSAGAAVLELANRTTVILNGSDGTLAVDPPAEAIQSARLSQQSWQQQRQEAKLRAAEPAVTQDGQRVEVVANIGGLKDAQDATQMGAEGVGLLRTEFLFLDRSDAPTEQEQYEVYRDIAVALLGQPVIVRTLDIGGDKPLPYVEVPHEENPFLGERGIRLCLNRPALFRQQLRAILRAASHGHLRIMFPMVADLSELRAARAMVDELRAELSAPRIDLGIMVEIPSAAVMADAFAWEVDFFSVGTNDLTQYTLAMDRMHPSLASKSDGLHPAVLRLISTTVEAAHKAGKWVGVCGELGADPQAVPILVGLGVDELSVSVPSIPTVKAQIRSMELPAAQALAKKALACATAAEVRSLSMPA